MHDSQEVSEFFEHWQKNMTPEEKKQPPMNYEPTKERIIEVIEDTDTILFGDYVKI